MTRPRFFAPLLLCLLALCANAAQAATRAWLDRDHASVGEAVALNIETDQGSVDPDLSPLQRDFELGDTRSSRQLQMVNGQVSRKTLFAVSLVPRRSGQLLIPGLNVGAERTAPLALSVDTAPAAVPGAAPAFVETEVDDPRPYVQQSVGVTVRLFYPPMASGSLEQPPPQGGALQPAGDDRQASRTINGRQYAIVERHYLLIPDRSGRLVLPGAVFRGRGARNWMDDFFGEDRAELRASARELVLDVRPQPDGAPQPWLPLHDLRLRYVGVPQSLRAGEAAALVVEAVADGIGRAQLPELPTPSVSGAQVFAEPAQYDERIVAGRPQVTLTRRYSLVPNGAGQLRVPGLRMPWWDVADGAAKTAALPDLQLQVAPGSGGFADSALPAATPDAASVAVSPRVPAADGDAGAEGGEGLWRWLAVVFAGLWLLTLLWAVWRRGQPPHGAPEPTRGSDSGARPRYSLPDLRRALDTGTLDEVAGVLRGMVAPPLPDLDALQARLGEAGQREAIEALRRARWADGDGVAARAALRAAFSDGPRWRAGDAAPPPEPLPPLYPL